MKKHAIILVIVMLISVFCFSACSNDEIYILLNSISKQQYAEVDLKITAKDEVELKAHFTATAKGKQTEVIYSYEQLASFEKADGEYDIPQDYIVTKQGVAMVQGNEIVGFNGDKIDEALEQFPLKGFRFNAAYFDNVKFTSNTFSASVRNPKAFMCDDELRSLNMKVEVEYVKNGIYTEKDGASLNVKTGDFLKSVKVTYTTLDGVEVTLDYAYKK